jgi:hypothetical protein
MEQGPESRADVEAPPSRVPECPLLFAVCGRALSC